MDKGKGIKDERRSKKTILGNNRIAAQPIPPPQSPPTVDAMIPDVEPIVAEALRSAEGKRKA